jgi:hypothetical protein
VLGLARRVAGLIVAFALVTGLPLAAARAGCVCDHGHQHGAAAAEPHTCTSACTAATCPMHRRASAGADAGRASGGETLRCSCAGEARALIGHVTTVAVLPSLIVLATPPAPPVAAALPPDAAPSLQPSPPAPPPRA